MTGDARRKSRARGDLERSCLCRRRRPVRSGPCRRPSCARLSPDIVALQEVDSRRRRSNGLDVFVFLRDRIGGHAAEARTIETDDGDYGHVVLSRWPLRRSGVHDISAAGRERRAIIDLEAQTPLRTGAGDRRPFRAQARREEGADGGAPRPHAGTTRWGDHRRRRFQRIEATKRDPPGPGSGVSIRARSPPLIPPGIRFSRWTVSGADRRFMSAKAGFCGTRRRFGSSSADRGFGLDWRVKV